MLWGIKSELGFSYPRSFVLTETVYVFLSPTDCIPSTHVSWFRYTDNGKPVTQYVPVTTVIPPGMVVLRPNAVMARNENKVPVIAGAVIGESVCREFIHTLLTLVMQACSC